MTVKALKKQLMAAIAMVVVSAIALSSSTYAWFASNNTVTATGLIVQAQTEGGIEIAYTDSNATSGTYSTTATIDGAAATSLAPISTLNTSAWYHASAQTAGASTAKIDTYETLTLTENAISGQNFGKTGGVTVGNTTTNYYMVQNFNIRSTSATALGKGLTVKSVSAANTSSTDMYKALRVAVVLPATDEQDANNVLIYAPYYDEAPSYVVYSGHTGSGDAAIATTAGTVNCTAKSTATLLADGEDVTIPAKNGNTNNGGVDVKIYVYFEGEDARLFSDNFSTAGLTVTVEFSATVS